MRILLLLALLGSACTRPLPPPPPIQTEGFLPAVRATVEEAQAKVRARPEDPQANGALAMVLHAHQVFAAAETFYQRAQARDPKSFRWAYLLATVQSAQGKLPEAVAQLRRAVSLDPAYRAARLQLGNLLLEMQQAVEAEREFRAVPDAAPAWYGLGRTQSARGDWAAAASSFTRACELHAQYGSAHYALAQALSKLNRQEEARSHLEAAERFKQASPPLADPLLEEVARLHAGSFHSVAEGVRLAAAGRLPEAAAAFEKAIQADPGEIAARYNLITVYGQLGRFDEARRHFEQTLRVAPNSEEAHYNYGVLQARRGQAGEAAARFRRVLEINPLHADAHTNLGYLAEERGELAEARRHYEDALSAASAHRQAHFRLGRLLLRQAQVRAAAGHFQRVVGPADADTAQALFGLAVAQKAMGNSAAAHVTAERARATARSLGLADLAAAIGKDFP